MGISDRRKELKRRRQRRNKRLKERRQEEMAALGKRVTISKPKPVAKVEKEEVKVIKKVAAKKPAEKKEGPRLRTLRRR